MVPPRRGRPVRREWWVPSFTASGLLHALLLTSAFAVPLAVLRGRTTERLAALAAAPAPSPVAELREAAEPSREVRTRRAELPEPELRPADSPPPREPPDGARSTERSRMEPEPPPVDASFARRAAETRAFPRPAARRSAPDDAEEPDPEEPAPPRAEPPPASAAVLEPPGVETDATAPELLPELSPNPPYPVLAQRMGWEGAVVCLVTVGPEGSVVDVSLERSSGHAVLDRAALEGVREWRFRPATRNGLAVEARVRKRLLFRLSRP